MPGLRAALAAPTIATIALNARPRPMQPRPHHALAAAAAARAALHRGLAVAAVLRLGAR